MADNEQVVVYAGFPKTASRWLLTSVWNRDGSGFRAVTEPRNLARDFILNNPLSFDATAMAASYRERIDSIRTAGDVPIIHHEGFFAQLFSSAPTDTRPFEQILATFPNCRVVLVVREQRAMLLSWYLHNVRNGLGVSLTRYLTEVSPGVTPFFRYDLFEYHWLVSYLQQRLGADRLLVLTQEQLIRDPNGYIEAIYGFTGVDRSGFQPSLAKRNVGLSALEARLLIWMNRFAVNDYPRPRRRGRVHEVCRKAVRIMGEYLPSSADLALRARYTSTVALHVGSRYGNSNSLLASQTGLDLLQYGYAMS